MKSFTCGLSNYFAPRALFIVLMIYSCGEEPKNDKKQNKNTSNYISNIENYRDDFQSWSQKEEVCKLRVYSPQNDFKVQTCGGGEKATHTFDEMKEILKNLDKEKTIIIGNGGAGAIGLLGYMAPLYNKDLSEEEKTTIVWRAAHSFQNLRDFDSIDLGITYEPHIELLKNEENKIIELDFLFINHFELSAPKDDPLCIKSYIKNPPTAKSLNENCEEVDDENKINASDVIGIMKRIILQTLSSPSDVSQMRYRFASRYNHSAMGEKDHTLFMLAIGELVSEAIKKASGNSPFDFGITAVNNLFSPAITYSEESLAVILYDKWMRHVQVFPTQFPWDMMKTANETGLYHSNDRAFYRNPKYKFDEDQYLSKIDDESISNPFINPADVWCVTEHHGRKNNKAFDFIKWAKTAEGSSAISSFRPENQTDQLYFPTNESFEEIYKAYNAHITNRVVSNNKRIEDRWMQHLQPVE